ncbi:putative glutathione S-transferase [Penicillium brasilianum]|uniref:glutathione transferase n=1 Tax=Penicillium brasilianum TaxID=104259 RepID=A0A1S9RYQ6_PENBI|nr:putative glutathione S-transferase [Penicillium brasilianum]
MHAEGAARFGGDWNDPTYVAEKHPFARIPAFEDDSTKLFESRAICRYLANKYSLDILGPESGLGLFEQAASVEYSYFDPPMKNLAYEKIFKRMMGHGEPDLELVSNYERQIRECFDYYERLLTKQRFLAGEAYTIVDAFHLPWIVFLERLNMSNELGERPHLLAWWKLMSHSENQGGFSAYLHNVSEDWVVGHASGTLGDAHIERKSVFKFFRSPRTGPTDNDHDHWSRADLNQVVHWNDDVRGEEIKSDNVVSVDSGLARDTSATPN